MNYIKPGAVLQYNRNGKPIDYTILVTSDIDSENEFDAVILSTDALFNADSIYPGKQIRSFAGREWQPLVGELSLGIATLAFQVGDIVEQIDEDDGEVWTGIVTTASNRDGIMSVAIITSNAESIKPGKRFITEPIEDWARCSFTINGAPPKFTVGQKVYSNLICGDNMIVVTEITNAETGTFNGVVVRNAVNPAQVGSYYTDLIPRTFKPYEEK